MTPPELVDQILFNTFIQTLALKRLLLLKNLAIGKLFGQKDSAKAADAVSSEQQMWLDSLDKDLFHHFTQSNVYKLFDDAEKVIKEIKPLTVYVSFDLPEKEISKIGQLLRQDYGKNFLIEIKLDPNLIAGCAFVWNGIYKDYSLRHKINENRQAVLSTLKGYIKH